MEDILKESFARTRPKNLTVIQRSTEADVASSTMGKGVPDGQKLWCVRVDTTVDRAPRCQARQEGGEGLVWVGLASLNYQGIQE